MAIHNKILETYKKYPISANVALALLSLVLFLWGVIPTEKKTGEVLNAGDKIVKVYTGFNYLFALVGIASLGTFGTLALREHDKLESRLQQELELKMRKSISGLLPSSRSPVLEMGGDRTTQRETSASEKEPVAAIARTSPASSETQRDPVPVMPPPRPLAWETTPAPTLRVPQVKMEPDPWEERFPFEEEDVIPLSSERPLEPFPLYEEVEEDCASPVEEEETSPPPSRDPLCPCTPVLSGIPDELLLKNLPQQIVKSGVSTILFGQPRAGKTVLLRQVIREFFRANKGRLFSDDPDRPRLLISTTKNDSYLGLSERKDVFNLLLKTDGEFSEEEDFVDLNSFYETANVFFKEFKRRSAIPEGSRRKGLGKFLWIMDDSSPYLSKVPTEKHLQHKRERFKSNNDNIFTIAPEFKMCEIIVAHAYNLDSLCFANRHARSRVKTIGVSRVYKQEGQITGDHVLLKDLCGSTWGLVNDKQAREELLQEIDRLAVYADKYEQSIAVVFGDRWQAGILPAPTAEDEQPVYPIHPF